MPEYILHYLNRDEQSGWAMKTEKGIFGFETKYADLSSFLKGSTDERRALRAGNGRALKPENLRFLSPVTHPCQILCQGQNYLEHIKEGGVRPEDKDFNLLFQKASSSLCAADAQIVRPANVQLLDYEIELGLVIGKDIRGPVQVTPETLHHYVAGIVIANDISARDVQIPQGQWYRGKSYRTFCPVGPYLALLNESEINRLSDLRLQLKVNGEIRQDALAGTMIYRPAETLTDLSGITDIFTGDLILTGTPAGVALKAPSPMAQRIAHLLFPEKKRMGLFVKKQLQRSQYLKNGDRINAAIFTEDRALDLGEQSNTVNG